MERPTFLNSLFRNWISLGGLVVLAGSGFAFLFLLVVDLFAGHNNPYVGILAYLVAPGFFFLGAALTVGGYLWQRRQLRRTGRVDSTPFLAVDLSGVKGRRQLVILVVVAVGFLLMTAIGSYQSYHFTESVNFCGQACHTVMEPEFTTYLHSPHARVACTECHIGPGAEWYVKAKISGLYQVYSTFFGKYSTPIPTPIENLRPAQDTCERCHWPQKFTGNLERTYVHYLTDETNTLYAVRMLLRVGGGDPKHGPVGGIHWHMNIANKVEYYATDAKRQKIPWIRTTDQSGKVMVYRTKDFTEEPPTAEVRTLDCIDCHNRPSHIFKSPNESVDLSLYLGRLDSTLPFIKKEAVDLLTQPYAGRGEAHERIAEGLRTKYGTHPQLDAAIQEVQQIYSDNFFPVMKSDWRAYPNNLGHKDWPGCFRCHDNEHTTADAQHVIDGKNCSACHILLAEGSLADLQHLDAAGRDFKHPEEGWEGMKCNDCHTGANE
jgi:nitrate/TMAO reductase-like tetraheme cytochrome c subunit